MDALVSSGQVALSGLMGAVVAYLGAMLKDIVSSRSKIDAALLKKRTELYGKLWSATQVVSKWPPNEGLDAIGLRRYSECIANWYFDQGGLMLSRRSQVKYVELQKAIWAVIENTKQTEARPNPQEYDRIHAAGSALRTSMTRDIYSRRLAPYA
jgi:hypothetical protein